MSWTLERFAYLPSGTIGELFIPGCQKIFTIERPWLDNRKRESCIPEGEYALKPHVGRIQPAIWVDGVPGRTAILIHVGNTYNDLQGCIAPGLHWRTGDPPAVLNSRAAMDVVMAAFAESGAGTVLKVKFKRALVSVY